MSKKSTVEEPKRNPDGTWPKGVSGNPSGKERGALSLVKIMREKLEEEMTYTVGEGKDKKTIKAMTAEQVVQKVIAKAVKDGDDRMLTLLFHYVDGKPVQPMHLGGMAGNPIEHVVLDEEEAKAMDSFEKRFMKVHKESQKKKRATNGQPDGNQTATKRQPVKKKVVIKKKK